MSLRESVWKGLYQEITEITLRKQEFNSLNHQNFVRKFVPMFLAMKFPDAKAVVDKEWGKLEKLPAWQLTKVKNKKEVFLEAQKEQRTVMDICHLKNAELEAKCQKIQRPDRTPR